MNGRAQQSLTPRQAEIAALVARGKSSREIARSLFLSPRTVDVHIAAIREKWKMRSRLELATKLLAGETERGEDRTAGSTLANAPSGASPVRRGGEIPDLVGVVRRTDVSSVSGAGAVGKLRVVLAVGDACAEDAQAEVWIVQLAPIAREGSSPLTQAAPVEESPDRALVETLIADLQQKSLVLIIEGYEHMVSGAAGLTAHWPSLATPSGGSPDDA